jgi:sterol desaturase/sphingolipid hydroxylase (fatty acid hydroxylase superfamily)
MWFSFYALFVSFFVLGSFSCWLLDRFQWGKRFIACDQQLLLSQYKKYTPLVACNLCLLLPCLVYITVEYCIHLQHELPSIWQFVQTQIFFGLCFEFLFFATHRLLHIPCLFRLVHYKHHEMVHSIGMGALYCHPLELVFSNYLPFALPVCFYPEPHVLSVYVWTALAGFYITQSHSGYAFPHRDPKHLTHHKVLNRYFGTLGIFDFLYEQLFFR